MYVNKFEGLTLTEKYLDLGFTTQDTLSSPKTPTLEPNNSKIALSAAPLVLAVCCLSPRFGILQNL